MELAAWLRLTLVPGVGGETRRALLSSYHINDTRKRAGPGEISRVVDAPTAERLRHHDCAAAIDAALEWAAQPGNRLLTLADAEYPQSLLGADDPPVLLHAKGRVELLNQPMLAIVGSRNATAQGLRDAEAFARALGEAGLGIVSGLALGIDAAAHRGALAGQAGTVAVIGTGADRVYPARNQALAREIAEKGVVISEFPLGTPALAGNFPRRNRLIAGLALGCLVVEAAPRSGSLITARLPLGAPVRPGNFPRRNRIIAGLSRGVLVVEAAPRSGSLITARLAAEAGREVFAIPGSIHSPLSHGCHQLIRQGAKLVETARDILEELRWDMPVPESKESAAAPGHRNAQEELLLASLGDAPCGVDILAQRSGLTPAELLAILLPMELAGRIAQLPGGLYQRLR